MWTFLRRQFLSLGVAFFLTVAPVLAQSSSSEEPIERGPPVPQYALAFVSLILVMLILCMPSRKRVAQ